MNYQPQHRIHLIIADFTFEIKGETPFSLEEGYIPFVDDHPPATPDISVTCFEGFPDEIFPSTKLVFEAENETQKFYSIFKLEDGYGFIIYNQQTKNEIQQIAMLDHSFTEWKVWSVPVEGILLPLNYPMGPIMMHYMTLLTDAVLLHASCAFDGQKGRIFTGFSGAGKSTMSKLWSQSGSRIINDDRLIVRRVGDKFMVYNTPMYYQDIPKVASLDGLYLISHSPENRIRQVKGALAVSKVMAFCIQNNFERQFIEKRLDFFTQLCAEVPVYELGFVPDAGVVPFILMNEQKSIE